MTPEETLEFMSQMSVAELTLIAKQLPAMLASKQREETARYRAELKLLHEKYPAQARPKAARKSSELPPKFTHGDKTWCGVGRPPKWFKEINAAAAEPSPQDPLI